MGLDISISRRKKIVCPACGEVVGYDVVVCEDSSGRIWYSFLESIGYYVPFEQRTEENDWYGKDMVLTEDQVKELYRFVESNSPYNHGAIRCLIATASFEHGDVVVNADW